MTNRFENPANPLEKERDSLLWKMSKVERMKHLNYGAKTMKELAQTFTSDVNEELDRATFEREHGRTPELTRQLFIFVAPPGSGKTHFKSIMTQYLDNWVQLNEERLFLLDGLDPIGSVTWEEDGELRARNAGEITTPSHRPFEEHEIKAANRQIVDAAEEQLSKSFITTMELPISAVDISLYRNGEVFVGRNMGGQLLHGLTMDSDVFSHKYNVAIAGITGGPTLRNFMVIFRDDIKNAKNLEEAQHIARIYGKNIPRNDQEWEVLRHGATLEQIEPIELKMKAVASLLEATSIKNAKNYGDMYSPLIKKVAGQLGMDEGVVAKQMMDAAQRAEIIQFLLKDNMLRVDNTRNFVGFNNPSLEDLGIQDLKALQEHLQKRKGPTTSLFDHIPESTD